MAETISYQDWLRRQNSPQPPPQETVMPPAQIQPNVGQQPPQNQPGMDYNEQGQQQQDPNYGLYAGTEQREGLSQKQSYVQQKTGIPTERFDPAWWAKGKREDGSWRPPDKIIWDSWTPQQRAAAGVPDWNSFSKYGQMHAQLHKPGGKFYEQKEQVKRDAAMIMHRNPGMPLDQILNSLGIYDIQEQGKPLFNSLMLEAQGLGGTGYQFDPATGMRYDTATSDLTKRGIGTPMTESDWNFYRGMQNARKNPYNNYMAQLARNPNDGIPYAKRAMWNKSGNTSTPNIPGTEYYGNQFGATDVYGNPINLQTGQIMSNSGYASNPRDINPWNPGYAGQQPTQQPIGGMGYGGGGYGDTGAYGMGYQQMQQQQAASNPTATPTQVTAQPDYQPEQVSQVPQVASQRPQQVSQVPMQTASFQPSNTEKRKTKREWNSPTQIGGMG